MTPTPQERVGVAVTPDVNAVRKRRKHKRRKRTAVFADSGLTKEGRRLTRMEQRSLYEKLQTSTTMEQLDDIAQKNNEIFKTSVRYTREAVLDADNLHLAVQKYGRYVESQCQVPRFDANKLVTKLKQKARAADGKFNWKLLGYEAGNCFNSLPERVTFLNCPLELEPTIKKKKERKEPRRYEVDLTEVIKPSEVSHGKQGGNPNRLGTTETTLRDMRKRLTEEVAESKEAGLGSQVKAAKILCNPLSFTQTVENFLHYSHLVKNGQASISVRDDSLEQPELYIGAETPERRKKPPAVQHQAVMTLTMQDWRAMCEYTETEDMPHRESM